jgi:hypothetical protein
LRRFGNTDCKVGGNRCTINFAAVAANSTENKEEEEEEEEEEDGSVQESDKPRKTFHFLKSVVVVARERDWGGGWFPII